MRMPGAPGGLHLAAGLKEQRTSPRPQVEKLPKKLGIRSPLLSPLWVEFAFRGVQIQQLERYFLLLIPRSDVCVGPELYSVHAREGIIAQRWWPAAELAATSETVFPEDLSCRLRGLTKQSRTQNLDP
jgi:hypothetical protein